VLITFRLNHDLLTLLTLGPQLRGSNNTKIGKLANQAVFELIHTIAAHAVEAETPTRLEIRNASQRQVVIAFSTDRTGESALPLARYVRLALAMTNQYYEPGVGRAAKVGDLFARIAPRYDLINDLQSLGLHRWWKRRFVALAAPRPGERALDLCCGTGDVTFALARRGAEAIGLDFSPPMLGVAKQREAAMTLRDDLPVPRFMLGDAQKILFPDDSFDLVTVSYGLRNLSDWNDGVREMLRVARPGGRLLALDFGKPDNALWRAFYFAYLRAVVPLFGRIFCGDAQAYAYILESLQHYPAQRGVETWMRDLGCHDVRVVQLLGGVMSINYGSKP